MEGDSEKTIQDFLKSLWAHLASAAVGTIEEDDYLVPKSFSTAINFWTKLLDYWQRTFKNKEIIDKAKEVS